MKKSNMAKKVISAILVLSMLCGILAMLPLVASAAPVADTTKGSKADPIIIESEADLKNLLATLQEVAAQKANPSLVTYYVELRNNINFEGRAMPDLDMESYSVHFEGGNHVIENFTATYGLFGALGENSTVQNLSIVGATVVAPGGGVGALLGTARDGLAVINCSTDETTTVTNNVSGPTGGLVGQTREGSTNNNIYFTDCTNNATVKAAGGNVGGIVGQVANAYSHLLINTCENNGAISGGTHSGGLVGSATGIQKLKLNECQNKASVTTTSGYAGGLVGYAKCYTASTETWTVTYSKNTGAITAPSYAGGIIGYAEGAPAYRVSYVGNTGNVTTTATASGTSAVGGILGYQGASNYARTVSFTNSYNEGMLTNNNAGKSDYLVGTGGIVGYFDAKGCTTVTISSCYDFGARNVKTGTYNKNGIIAGYLANGTTMNVTACKGTIQGDATAMTPSSVTSTENSATVASKAEIASTMKDLERRVMLRSPKGDGSKENPFKIGTDMQLQHFMWNRPIDNEVYIEITDNIDFGGYELQIDLLDSREYVARPVYVNGNGYTISNYTSKTGIFERIGGGSIIKNLNVANATITNPADNRRHAGAIVGYVEGDFTMVNCSAESTVTVVQNSTNGNVAGGLVGSVESANAYMLFVDCINAATVKSINAAGGVLGKIYSAGSKIVFMNCRNKGSVSGSDDAGIVGNLQIAASADFYGCKDTRSQTIYANAGNDVTVTVHDAGEVELLSRSVTQDLAIRIKLTDHFGLMAITEISKPGTVVYPEPEFDRFSPNYGSVVYGPDENGSDPEMGTVGSTPANLADYEYGFYFLESKDRVTPEELKANGTKTAGTPYSDSRSVFYATYTDMRAVDIARNVHFMAYVTDSEGNEILGSMRTVDVAAMIEDMTDGKVGSQTVTTSKYEIDLYQSILDYSEAYDRHLYGEDDINIGVLNLGQSNMDKTVVSNYFNASPSNIEKNLDAFANTMYTLDLDVMGLNECDIYRGSSSSYGGYHTPWEIAQRMEDLTGEQYYWAFATALNETAKNSKNEAIRPFYNRYSSKGIEGPDGLYYSGDGKLSGYATSSGYGEGLVSKYPIVAVEQRIINVAKYLDEYGTDAEKEYYKDYNASYQYDPATGYERRVILIATLEVDGNYVTVMVTHWDHKGYSIDGSTNTFTRKAATLTCIEAMEDYSDRPVVLMGDLNTGRDSAYIKDLDKTAFRAGSDNMTGTFSGSGAKIDHIYYNGYAKLRSYKVETTNEVSDHYPVHVTLRLSEEYEKPESANPNIPDLLETTLPLSLEPTSSYPAGDGGTVMIYEGVTESFLQEYQMALSEAGLDLYTTSDFSGTPTASYKSKGSNLNINRFATYVSAKNSVDLQYHAYGYLDSHALKEADSTKPAFGNKFSGGILFATISPRSGLTLPLQEAPDYVALDSNEYPTIVTQVGLDDHHQRLSSNCYIIRLADGSFIIHDSGYGNTDANGKSVGDKIYDILYKQAPDKNDIVISAWISSHPHADHTDGLTYFANKYASNPNVTVKQFVHNFGDDTFLTGLEGGPLYRKNDVQTAMKKFPNATYVKPHTGNVLYYANVKFNIVYTQENYLQLAGNAGYDTNSASMIMQMVTDKGMKVLFGGDGAQMDHYNGTAPYTFNAIAKRYGTFLDSNVLVYFHHGLGGGSSWEANEAIKPEVVLWPVSHGKIEDAKTAGTDLMESSHSIYFTRQNRYTILGSNRFPEGSLQSSANHAGVYGYFIADNNIHIVNLDKQYKTGVPTVTTYDTHDAYFNS